MERKEVGGGNGTVKFGGTRLSILEVGEGDFGARY